MHHLVFQSCIRDVNMYTVNLLCAFLRNTKLLPFNRMSQSTKCSAACPESNLTSVDLFDLDTCNSSRCSSNCCSSMAGRLSSFFISNFFSFSQQSKTYLGSSLAWGGIQDLLSIVGWVTVPLFGINLIVLYHFWLIETVYVLPLPFDDSLCHQLLLLMQRCLEPFQEICFYSPETLLN